MSMLKRLLPTQDNAERRLILSEVLGEPVSLRLMKFKIQQMKQKQQEQVMTQRQIDTQSESNE